MASVTITRTEEEENEEVTRNPIRHPLRSKIIRSSSSSSSKGTTGPASPTTHTHTNHSDHQQQDQVNSPVIMAATTTTFTSTRLRTTTLGETKMPMRRQAVL
jgi:hypothetical protein